MRKVAPLSQTQLGIYLDCLSMEEPGAYNRHFLFTLDTDIDMNRLSAAIEKAVAAHPAMNVRIVEQDGEPVQEFIAENYRQSVEQITEDSWQKKLSELVAEPLELHGGRLFRFNLVQTEKAKYFFRTTHHIFFDGMSYKVFFDDVAKFYENPDAEIVAENYDALDAANEEIKFRSTEKFSQAKNWYEKNFGGLDVEALPIPDCDDIKVSFDTFTKIFPLDYSTLRNFCRANKISASALTSAAFAITVGTYTNQQESLFSTIYHGRKDERTKNIIGMFVKTLPVYCRWNGDKKISELLSEITDQIKLERENDLFSFIDLNKICPMNNAPIFAYHGLIRTTSEVCGKPCEEKLLDVNTTGNPLDVELMSVADGMKIRIEYNSAKYSADFIKTFAKCYENVLRQLMAKTFVREIELLDAEQIKILDDFNKSEVNYDKNQTVISLFNTAVKKFADNTAIIFEDKKFTYSEVDKISNDIAAYILGKNIRKGDVVSILIPRCEFMTLAPLGALKAGCTYQPLDATYPAERLNFMVKDSAAKILITTKNLRKLITDFDGEVLFVDEIPQAENFSPNYVNSPEDIFILLYTSGSTGVPKGVKLTHANLVCFINWYRKYYNLTEKDCVGAYASFGFDVCMEDMYSTLASGATLCIIPEEMRFNLADLNIYLEKNNVTYIHMTTQIGRQFATDIDNHSLKALTVGGEKLATMDPPKKYALYNTYGPTETTISVTEFKVKKAEKDIPIGKPLDNVKLYIVDLNGHRVPIGACGELWAAGPQVGAGYLNRPEKTAEVFIKNPFDGGEYENLYRTGDIVRYRADGNIEFIGRRDGQVKIRGFRIELSEVEAVIREFPAVKDATVAAFDNPAGGKFIAAYVVGEEKISVEELNKFIAERKPPYMVPAVTMQIDKIPFNQNGKVNKRALPKATVSTSDKEIVQPRTDAEKKVCDVLAELIGTNNFSVTATLDELGVNSVTMMRLTLKLSREFSHSLNFADLRRYNTPEKLAAFMQDEQITDKELPILEDYPLTKTQEGIFFETQSHEGTTIYNIPLLLEFDGSFDFVRLKEAIAAAVNAHSYLLTRFFQNDEGELRQRRSEKIKFTTKDIQEVHFKNLEDLKKQLVCPYDLLNDRLFRISLVNTEDGKNYLYMDMHHSIFDGESRQIFIRDIERAYNGQILTPEKFSGYEVALLEERLRSGEQYQKSKDYYTKIFDGCESDCLPLPDIEAGDEDKSFSRKIIAGNIDLKAVKDFCVAAGVTENAFYTAAFGYVTARYSGRNDSVFTTINNGRIDTRFADSVSMFVRTYPVLCNLKTDSVLNYIRSTAQQLTDSLSYNAYSFEEISRDLYIHSDLLFAFQGAVSNNIESFCGVPCKEIPVSLDESKAGIEFTVHPQGNSVAYHVNCRKGLYSEAFIQRFVRAYDFCLSEFISKENLSAIELCDAEEINLLDDFNKSEVNYDKNQTVISLFNTAVKNFSDNTAIIFEDKKFTYSEVDKISNDIAAYILGKNIGKGDVVSILIPRCEFMPITALGALKAGCAYQPLDPSYPAERLNFMVKDSAAKILITTKELRKLITDFDGEVLFVDEIPQAENFSPEYVNSSEDIFILLYTSGSTGVPKGVKLTHANLVCFIKWYKKFYNLTEKNCVGAYASFGFDANIMDTYPALTSGAALCIVPEEMRLDLEAMNNYFEKNSVTHAFMTTQVGRQFATDIENKYLKYLTVGGEKLVTLNPPKNFALVNAYGPTECTILITAFKVEKAERNIPIGKSLDNVKLYVVDSNGHRVPVGACGELWAAGLQVGAGYLNRPEKTAEVFIKNPFDGGEYENLYRTGDIVRYRADGNIEFIGRRDGQVKIRGFRIELSEVEAVIREFPAVKDATVAAFDNPAGGKFIAAYVVGEEKISVEELNKFIAERKPPYMVPAVTMQIDKIPLNQNSKVNKRALPKPEIKIEVEENSKGNLNILEKNLQEIIGEIVGVKEFGISTELNLLGLTSISSIRLATKIYKKFGLNIPVKKLLGGSIESIENEILQNWMSGQVAEQKNISTQKNSEKISGIQRGIYLECMKNPFATIYNVPFILNFENDLNISELSAAVKKIISSHQSVNIHFELQDEDIMQVRNSKTDFDIPVKNISEKDFAELKNNFVQPFKLSTEPLYRFMIVQTEKRVSLFADFHHLIFDGVSMNLFFANLQTALEGKNIEAEKFTYFDYTAEESKLIDENKKYFAEMLQDFESASEITSDAKNSADEVKIFDSPLNLNLIDNYCNENKITPATFCLSVLGYTIARYTASQKIYLTTISSGRQNVKYSDTFGMFVNTLPLKIELSDADIKNFIENVADTFNKTVEHENYPFSQIAQDYNFAPKIMYEYQRGVVENFDIPKFIGRESFKNETSKFKMVVRIVDREKTPCISIEYNSADYTDNFIRNFAKSFNIVLKKFATEKNLPVKKVSLIDDERKEILKKFRNNTFEVGKVYKFFHEGFEDQVDKNPEKIALIAADCTLIYKELEENANKIANALLERGVKPKNKIALLLPRNSREIISMFGVLKAGCAFIPCDVKYPEERINQILEDSAAPYVITTSDKIISEKFIDVEELLQNENILRPKVEISPEDLAYLIYTSGSTGKPKGVMIPHHSVANFFTNNPANIMVDILTKTAKNFVSVSTFSFDLSLKELALPLFNGLTLTLADDEQANNPAKLAELIRRTNGDAINATPSRLYQYMESEEFTEALKDFKFIGSGGEKYLESLLKKLRENTSAKIINTYGPTETTISSNMADLTNAKNISVGRPLLNVTEFIVDGDGNELPPGIVGELYIGGEGVGKGYNNLPEKTAERFIDYNGMKIYKSGDYARWTAEGDVEILGRMDNQIKLRGLRIEIGEIEGTIAKIPEIKTVVVKIVKIKNIEHLCAYFTAEKIIDIENLKNELTKTLPQYMVPTAYLQMEKMPMTLNGKIDLKNLPEATIFRSKSSAKAENKIEKDFCEIFEKILRIEEVGADESFFDLGGTSLLVTRVVIMAQKLGYKINFSDVFTSKTPRELANLQEKDTDKIFDSEIEDFDYSKFENILSENNLDNFKTGESQPLGNIVLTGANGYLGIHILHEFIENHDGKIYCLLRGKKDLSAENRLKAQLYYYFDENYSELFGKKIFVLEGDVTLPETLEQIKNISDISTVINCAALVKHFSAGNEIETVNVGGVKNLIEVCKEKNLRFIQISTMSTVRVGIKGEVDETATPDEKTLYFRQSLTNKYVRSKFLAERLILNSILNDGLNAKIMRVGTLSARYSDGEFQINAGTNSSMGRLKIYAILGACPFAQMDNLIEFSPIDEVAKTILILSETPKKCVIFHPINHHNMAIGDVVRAMQSCGLDIKFVEQEDFQKVWQAAEENPDKAKILTSSIAYRSGNKDTENISFPKNNLYTMQVLYRLGYSWPVTMWEYVEKFINLLQKLGFFSV